MDSAGVDTELRLGEDLYKIRKVLTASDVNHSSRLLLLKGCVETHVLEEMRIRVKEGERMVVTVRDDDKRCEHRLMFRYRASRSYQLDKGWKKQFVNRRRLKVGDEIGMYLDRVGKFHITVLRRAARDPRFH